jgi:hypothetical protein
VAETTASCPHSLHDRNCSLTREQEDFDNLSTYLDLPPEDQHDVAPQQTEAGKYTWHPNYRVHKLTRCRIRIVHLFPLLSFNPSPFGADRRKRYVCTQDFTVCSGLELTHREEPVLFRFPNPLVTSPFTMDQTEEKGMSSPSSLMSRVGLTLPRVCPTPQPYDKRSGYYFNPPKRAW